MRNTIYIKFNCLNCGQERSMAKGRYESYKRKKNMPPSFCNPKCVQSYRARNRIIFNCKMCGQKASQSESQFKKSSNHFCNKQCSLTWQNTYGKKRTKTKQCLNCNTLIFSDRKRCDNCHKQKMNDFSILTLKDLKYSGPNKYNLIRFHSKKQMINHEKKCQNCNYDVHVEVCHIKPVSKFADDTKMDIINHPDNLLLLCPNCHYEFDHIKQKRIDILNRCKKQDYDFKVHESGVDPERKVL